MEKLDGGSNRTIKIKTPTSGTENNLRSPASKSPTQRKISPLITGENSLIYDHRDRLNRAGSAQKPKVIVPDVHSRDIVKIQVFSFNNMLSLQKCVLLKVQSKFLFQVKAH